MTAGDGTKAVVVIVDRDIEAVMGRVVGVRPDVALVGALASLQLEARRQGCSIRLRDPCQELYDLLDLVGLTDVLTSICALSLESSRQAEGGEQLGVQEVVQPGDPPA